MKKKVTIFLIILSILSLIFTYNDDFIYKKEIMKITKIKIVDSYISKNNLELEEKYTVKEITGIITNGKNKGDIETFTYEESYSSVITDKYKIHDKVFVKNNSIDGFKRDIYIVFLINLFIIAIFIVGEYQGLLSIVSVILNIIIFYISLLLYFKGINLLFLSIIMSIIFSILSLSIANGINKMTKSAILSCIISIFIMLLMLLIIIKTTNYSGTNLNELSFLTVPVEDIVLPELIIGTLGAVMDVAITISSSIKELIDKDNNISINNLKKSSKQIGKDIMSTMSNVLFFTYLAASLPIFVLAIRNGYSLNNYIRNSFSLEISRFLVGSIGIVMTIPISTFISIKIFKGGKYE